jgi:quinol monooxygenase YgiN
MAIGILFTIDCSQEQYETVMRRLEAAGAAAPRGRRYHVAGPAGGAWRVVDVWDSQAAFEAFAHTLLPVMQEVGIPPIQPDVFSVHNIVVGRATSAA